MNAVNATRPDIASIGPGSLRARLDLLLQHAITLEHFEADVTRLCQVNSEEIWTVLALLDQYHRRGLLPTPLFKSLKASADRRGLGRQGATPAPAPATTSAMPAVPTVAPVPTVSPPALPAAPAASNAPAASAAQASAKALPAGTVLRDRYVIEELLGRGTRSCVYRALDRERRKLPQSKQHVALKILRAAALTGSNAQANLRVEFQCAQSMSHPNVVNVYELEQDGALSFLTMELLDGEPLEALLERQGRQALPRPAALAIIRDVGAALVHAHERGVVHGNLQPRHIMITASGEVRVTNFAAARADYLESAPEANVYASCEALEGQVSDRRDDLYALACISYELLAGHHPFNRLSAAQARGRSLVPRRPTHLGNGTWRALRAGLAWRRENRTVGIGWWLSRMNLSGAAPHLPTLQELHVARPPARRLPQRPVMLLCALGVSIAAAAALDRLPTPRGLANGWQELRATHLRNPLQRFGDWLSPAPAAVPGTTHKSAASVRHSAAIAGNIQRHARTAGSGTATSARDEATPEAVTDVAAAGQSATESTAQPVGAAATPAEAAVGGAANTSGALHVAAAATPPPHIDLTADNYTVLPGEPAARVVVRRRGSLQGDVSFVWSTEGASAQPERDFIASGPRAEQIPAGVGSVTLLVPIVSDGTRNESRVFYVTIGEPGGGAELGPNARASVLVAGGN
jgi:serine/threonine protein kinase